jgi:hypothetical protein
MVKIASTNFLPPWEKSRMFNDQFFAILGEETTSLARRANCNSSHKVIWDKRIIKLKISGGRRKLHYLYPDTTELVEELDVTTNEVLGKHCDKLIWFSEEMEEIEGIRRSTVGVGDRRAA